MSKPARIFSFWIDGRRGSIYEDGSVDDNIKDRLKSKDGSLMIVNDYRAIQQQILGQVIALKNQIEKL